MISKTRDEWTSNGRKEERKKSHIEVAAPPKNRINGANYHDHGKLP